MSARPKIFISAVSGELRSLRSVVAAIVYQLGYDADFQEIFGTEQGDLTSMLERRIDACVGVLQLVGLSYGYAPKTAHPDFGSCSYTQFEALYARSVGKKVWYIVLDDSHPRDGLVDEPAECIEAQAHYRESILGDSFLYHASDSVTTTELCVHRLRNDLETIRAEWEARMQRQEKAIRRLAPIQIIALVLLILVAGGGYAIWRKVVDTNIQIDAYHRETEARLQRLVAPVDRLILEYFASGASMAKARERLVEGNVTNFTSEDLAFINEVKQGQDVTLRALALFAAGDYEQSAFAAQSAGEDFLASSQSITEQAAKVEQRIKAAKNFYRAGLAFALLGRYDDAKRMQIQALDLTSSGENPEFWADVKLQIGIVLFEQARREERSVQLMSLLTESKAAFEDARRIWKNSQSQSKNLLLAQANLANTLIELSRQDKSHSVAFAREAVAANNEGLRLCNENDEPTAWALIQTNLAVALTDLAENVDQDEGRRLLNQASEATSLASTKVTEAANLVHWARLQNTKCNLFTQQSRLAAGHERLRWLEDALKVCVDTAGRLSASSHPVEWNAIKHNQATVLVELAQLNPSDLPAVRKGLLNAQRECESAMSSVSIASHPNEFRRTSAALEMIRKSLSDVAEAEKPPVKPVVSAPSVAPPKAPALEDLIPKSTVMTEALQPLIKNPHPSLAAGQMAVIALETLSLKYSEEVQQKFKVLVAQIKQPLAAEHAYMVEAAKIPELQARISQEKKRVENIHSNPPRRIGGAIDYGLVSVAERSAAVAIGECEEKLKQIDAKRLSLGRDMEITNKSVILRLQARAESARLRQAEIEAGHIDAAKGHAAAALSQTEAAVALASCMFAVMKRQNLTPGFKVAVSLPWLGMMKLDEAERERIKELARQQLVDCLAYRLAAREFAKAGANAAVGSVTDGFDLGGILTSLGVVWAGLTVEQQVEEVIGGCLEQIMFSPEPSEEIEELRKVVVQLAKPDPKNEAPEQRFSPDAIRKLVPTLRLDSVKLLSSVFLEAAAKEKSQAAGKTTGA